MPRCCFSLCAPGCAALVVLAFTAGMLRAGELPAEFASEAEPALAKMQRAYQHATIRGVCRLSFPTKANAPARTFDFQLRTDGDGMNLTETDGLEAEKGQAHTPRPPHSLEVTDNGARMREGDGAWQPTDPNNARGYIGWVTQIRHVYGQHLLDFLRNPARTVDSIERTSEDGLPIVRITCHWEDTQAHVHNTAAYDLSPTEGWALRRYVNTWKAASGSDPEGRYTIQVDYAGESDGVPVIKRAEEALSHGPKFDVEQLTVVDFSNVEFDKRSGPQAF